MTQHLLLGHFCPPMQGRASNPHLLLRGQLNPADTKAQRGQVLTQSHTLLHGVAGRAQVSRCLLRGLHVHQVCDFKLREWCHNGIYILAPTIRQRKTGGQTGTLPPPPRL